MWRSSLLALAACGRIAFDAVPGGDASPGAGGFAAACRANALVVVRDGIASDDNAGAMMPSPLVVGCGREFGLNTVLQDDPGVLDPATNQPLLAPGTLGLLAGGTAPQRALHYLQVADTPVIVEDTTSRLVITTRAGATVIDIPLSSLDSSHDITVVQYACAGTSGACVVSDAGEQTNGTIAGAYYFDNVIAPAIATSVTSWYVIEWKNTDTDPAPSAGDTYSIVGSG